MVIHLIDLHLKLLYISFFMVLQMDYLLGSNPNKRSYMAGFGANPPTQPHHRGASVPVLHINTVVDCSMSFSKWFQRDAPNYNVLTGAIVGGPDKNDKFEDKRSQSSMLEPTTYINSLAIGPLVELAVHGK
jgi:endoglucanase